MEKNQIIEIIKANPEMSQEEIKQQALTAGVTEVEFEAAWVSTQKKPRNKRAIVLLSIMLALVAVGTYMHFGKMARAVGINYCHDLDWNSCRDASGCRVLYKGSTEVFGGMTTYTNSFRGCKAETKKQIAQDSPNKELCENTGGAWARDQLGGCECPRETAEDGFFSFQLRGNRGCISMREVCDEIQGDWLESGTLGEDATCLLGDVFEGRRVKRFTDLAALREEARIANELMAEKLKPYEEAGLDMTQYKRFGISSEGRITVWTKEGNEVEVIDLKEYLETKE